MSHSVRPRTSENRSQGVIVSISLNSGRPRSALSIIQPSSCSCSQSGQTGPRKLRIQKNCIGREQVCSAGRDARHQGLQCQARGLDKRRPSRRDASSWGMLTRIWSSHNSIAAWCTPQDTLAQDAGAGCSL